MSFPVHTEYELMQWMWRRLRLISAGEAAVKEWDVNKTKGSIARDAFILKAPAMSEDGGDDNNSFYNYIVYNTRFIDAFARTVQLLHGLLFYADPVLKLPKRLQEAAENIDQNGAGFADIAKEAADEVLIMGRGGLFVDFPKVEGRLTIARMEEDKVYPFMRNIKVEDIIDWEFATEKNVTRLNHVIFVTERDSNLEPTKIKLLEIVDGVYTISEYEIGAVKKRPMQFAPIMRLLTGSYVSGSVKAWLKTQNRIDFVTPRAMNGETLDSIPFWFTGKLYDQKNIQKPPLLSIADLNVAHYRLTAQLTSLIYHCANPTPIFCGFIFDKNKPIKTGTKQGLATSTPEAHAEYLEVSGNGAAVIRNERDAVVVELSAAGASTFASQAAADNAKTGTAKINAASNVAILDTIAGTLDSIFTEAFKYMAKFTGETVNKNPVRMNREFMHYRLTANELTVLFNMFVKNAIGIEEFIDILKRGSILTADTTVEQYKAGVVSSRPFIAASLKAIADAQVTEMATTKGEADTGGTQE